MEWTKKYLTILGVVTVICIGAGLLINVVRPLSLFGSSAAQASRLFGDGAETLDDFSGIRVEADSADISLRTGSAYTVSVDGAGNTDVRVEDQILYIEQRTEGRWPRWLGINHDRTCKITITVPQGTVLERTQLATSAGDIHIEEITSAETLLEADMGNVHAEDSDLGEVSAETNMGNIKCSHIRIRNASFESDMGNVVLEVDDTASSYELRLETSLGNVRVNGEKTANEVHVNNADAAYTLTAESSLGNVEVTFSD